MAKLNTTNRQIFILSGQSNMSGRGGISHGHWNGFLPPECRSHPSVLRLSINLQWEVAHEPLHADIDAKKVCGVGPGMAFANAMRDQIGVIGLVPCAIGGTSIKKWARGHLLFDEMLHRAKQSLKQGGEIKALVWYQGESDTSNQHDAEDYKKNMEDLINSVRADLGLPSLPVVHVAIASAEGKYMEKVRESQLGIDLPNVVCVDAKGLNLKEDHLHLTTESQVKLGLMLADAYLEHFAALPRPNNLLRKSMQLLYGSVVFALLLLCGWVVVLLKGT